MMQEFSRQLEKNTKDLYYCIVFRIFKLILLSAALALQSMSDFLLLVTVVSISNCRMPKLRQVRADHNGRSVANGL